MEGQGEEIKIVLDSVHEKFTTEDGAAFLQYKIQPAKNPEEKQVMDIQHTYVPGSMRGLGVAGLLCKAAFAHARNHNLLVLPTCSYVSVRRSSPPLLFLLVTPIDC